MKASLSLVVAVAAVGSLCVSSTRAEAECPKLSTVPDFNVTEYTRKTWYFQKQQITGYLPRNTFYCVAATYNLEGKKVPFFSGRY